MRSITEHIAAYERLRKASQMKPADSTIYSFINYCLKNFDNHADLQQWMVDQWCQKHETEMPNSHYTRVAHLNTFLRFLQSRQLANVHPYENIKWNRREKNIIFITEEELNNFFKALNELPINTPKQKVDALTWAIIFRVYYSTGMRPLEARCLSRNDVDLDNGIIAISHTKGYREHFVAPHDSLLKVLIDYDEIIDKIYPNREIFFVLGNGKSIESRTLNYTFQKCWHKYNTRHCVGYHLRHNYAIENIHALVNLGCDYRWNRLVCLSKSMGHSKFKETLYYYSLGPQSANQLRELSEPNLNKIIPTLPNEEEAD